MELVDFGCVSGLQGVDYSISLGSAEGDRLFGTLHRRLAFLDAGAIVDG